MAIRLPDDFEDILLANQETVRIFGDWPRTYEKNGETFTRPLYQFSSKSFQPVSLMAVIEDVSDRLDELLDEPPDIKLTEAFETDEGYQLLYVGMPSKYSPTPQGNSMTAILSAIRSYIIRKLAEQVASDIASNGLTAADEAVIDGIVADTLT